MIENGSFEEGIAPWKVLGATVSIVESDEDAMNGKRALAIAPDDGEWAHVTAPRQALFQPDEVSKITLSFFMRVFTRDTLRMSDVFIGDLEWSRTGCDTEYCRWSHRMYQDKASWSWERVSFDATASLTSVSPGTWELGFAAKEGFVFPSVWYVDGVSVRVCTR